MSDESPFEEDDNNVLDLPEGDPATQPGAVSIDRADGRSPSGSVVRGVAAVVGKEPTEMRPLYDVVDPDALNRLLRPPADGMETRETGRVSFRYEGCDVYLVADGRTVVVPPDGE